ncbi:hypothetical protein [Aeromonas rivipollensis]|uniref:capsular polysaccharide export protein, LipB/KpsS family n=1 Tax=Aeromonas rivipollensis TaxID=948519 RepID=UPI003D219971
MNFKSKARALKSEYIPIAKSIMYRANPLAKTAWVFNVAKWKRPILKKYFPQYKLRFLAVKDSVYDKHHAINLSPRPIFLVWGMIQPDDLDDYANEFSIPIYRIEDGFIRSIGLGSSHILPHSLCIDHKSIYFNSYCESELESLLSNYDFDSDRDFITRSNYCLDLIRKYSISKYNEKRSDIASMLYGPKTTKRVLVLGQVEDDQSLLYGCESIRTNAELVKLAYDENPTAQIIFKTHPDVLSGNRRDISSVSDIKKYAEIIPLDISLKDALYNVDHVYTQTSLGGFEALIYGVKVTTIGAPFYSGWGITDDRFKVGRRNRILSLEKIFYAAYIIYPRYYDPENKKVSSLEDTLNRFIEEIDAIEKSNPSENRKIASYKFINFKTGTFIQNRYITHSRTEKVCIITDNPKALSLARLLSKYKRNVSLMYSRDSLVNIENSLINDDEQERLEVTSIHKKYGVTMSEIEEKTISFIELLSSNFQKTMSCTLDKVWSDRIIDVNSNGFGNYLYFEALRYNAMKEVLLEFDTVLVLQQDASTMRDVSLALAYHSKILDRESAVYYGADTYQEAKSFFDNVNETLNQPQINTLPDELSSDYVKRTLNSVSWDIQNSYAYRNDNSVIVCGNLQGDNYAYLPATMRAISCINEKTKNNIIYLGASYLSPSIQDESKNVTYSDKAHSHFEVYDGNITAYKRRYSDSFSSIENIFKIYIRHLLITNLSSSLPSAIIKIILPRVDTYLNSVLSNFYFIAELNSIFNANCVRAFVTTMEMSVISRLVTAVAAQKDIISIGLQPQIISHSARYSSHTVNKMGVIDSHQASIYEYLGASQDTLFKVGSENITSRLNRIENSKASQPVCDYDIFFAMQHSCAKTIISISIALKNHLNAHGGRLIVKPHPHQELSVLNKVKSIFSECENVLILSREADTYTNLVRARIVVGYFSSVLLEASLSGMDVIVAAFHGIHESVDFSNLGLAIKVDSDVSLSYELLSEDRHERLRVSREEYFSKNRHFISEEDNHDLIDNFLIANIPS